MSCTEAFTSIDAMKHYQTSLHWPASALCVLDENKSVVLVCESIVIEERLDAALIAEDHHPYSKITLALFQSLVWVSHIRHSSDAQKTVLQQMELMTASVKSPFYS